jgi:flavin reductase (DIM6/NTAB) family NADH-FMN oxidoreductase RutF
MNALAPDMGSSFVPDKHNTRLLRDAFGRFATGVTIVTAPSLDGPVGMTANSFSSVSLDPPMVLWAPGKASRRFGYFADAPYYAIHVLSTEQADLCMAFGKEAFALNTLSHTLNEHGVPLMEGCLARFECSRIACHEGGDHMIVLGGVDRAEIREGEPLAFFGGNFGKVVLA